MDKKNLLKIKAREAKSNPATKITKQKKGLAPINKKLSRINKKLARKVARLESINDHLKSEITQLDTLMRLVGFSGGIKTIKLAAEEIILKESEDFDQDMA